MKTIFLSFSLGTLCIMSMLAGCGNDKGDEKADAGVPQGMVAVDLNEYGLPVLINVPDSTVGRLETEPNPLGGVNVRVGKNFQLTIIGGEGNIAMKKNDITTDEVRRFIKYVVDEPNTLVWEWQMEGAEPEFHFYTIVEAGGEKYEVYNEMGIMFSEKAIMDMLDAAKSIRPRNVQKKGNV